jgi:divalent metal cation (Fe/Co/Zn/Cd) transporter
LSRRYGVGMPTVPGRAVLLRRGLRLEYATLAWNAGEVGFLFYAAAIARSVALAGFALDSCIEIFASLVVVWRLKGVADAARERHAERLIGYAFFALAIYLTAQAIITVIADVRPASSPLGIGWLAATVVAMFALANAKLRTGRALHHSVLQAEAKVTMVDGTLAAAILLGLILNATLGWWWADIAGGIVVVVYGLREGFHAIRESR